MPGSRRAFQRSDRVADQLQRELAELIRDELKDPRIGMVTLREVNVTRDLSHAKVYFSVLGGEATPTEVAKGLNHATGFLRAQLGRRMRLRVLPTLKFLFDDSAERGAALSAAISAAVRDDEVKAQLGAGGPDDLDAVENTDELVDAGDSTAVDGMHVETERTAMTSSERDESDQDSVIDTEAPGTRGEVALSGRLLDDEARSAHRPTSRKSD